MLKRLHLVDFKSFADEQVELAPLTVLVGANASGKINFLDAIQFLQGLVLDLLLSEVLSGEKRSGSEAWPGIRGRVEEAARIGARGFQLHSTWLDTRPLIDAPLQSSDGSQVSHSISCQGSPRVELQAEMIEVGGELLYGRRGGDARSVLGALKNGSPKEEEKEADDLVGVARLREILRRIQFLDIQPARMRDYGRRGNPLGVEGRNLSGVLADLSDKREEKDALVRWLTELCASEIEDLDFVGVEELGDVMAMFVEAGGKRISARSISDGTLHFLGTLLALRTAEPGSVILIEELESGLHPTRIRLLVEYLETVAQTGNIQVIATTHSPVVLQWLSAEALRNTVLFGRVSGHEGTMMCRLGDLPHFNEAVQRQGIDEMFTTGWLEMAL